jgi:hypothetical protein
MCQLLKRELNLYWFGIFESNTTKGRCIISHWTKSIFKLNDLDLMERVAEEMGLGISRKRQNYKSRHAGTIQADMVLTDNKGGSAAIVEQSDGTYQTILDNYNNPITSVVGHDCQMLCRNYTTELVKSQAMVMGGVVSGLEVLNDGSVEVHITI